MQVSLCYKDSHITNDKCLAYLPLSSSGLMAEFYSFTEVLFPSKSRFGLKFLHNMVFPDEKTCYPFLYSIPAKYQAFATAYLKLYVTTPIKSWKRYI